MKHKR